MVYWGIWFKLVESWYRVYESSVEACNAMYEHCVGCVYFTPELKEQLCQHDPDGWDPETCYRDSKEEE